MLSEMTTPSVLPWAKPAYAANAVRFVEGISMSDGHLLGPLVQRYLGAEIAADRKLTVNTQRSYGDSIQVFLRFLRDDLAVATGAITIEQTTATVVQRFLAHLGEQRGNAASTRNQRLKAIHSLFRFVAREIPSLAAHTDAILAIPLGRSVAPAMGYLEKAEMDALLTIPDRRRAQGRRDYALLLFLYNTGARASEAAELTMDAITLDGSASVRFASRGRRNRECPLWPETVEVLREVIGDRINAPAGTPVFYNVRGAPITRFGIHTLVARTVARAIETMPSLRDKRVSPHTIRRTTIVHLLRAGVELRTIRTWLGHAATAGTSRAPETRSVEPAHDLG